MNPTEWNAVKSILAEALALPASERLAWLTQLQEVQPDVIREVERLLLQEIESTLNLSGSTDGMARSAPDRMLRPGDKPLDRFEILFFLGSGGMGEVYAAFDNDVREVIALKTLRADLADEPMYVRRLQKEVQVARRLRHENLCRVYDTHSIFVKGSHTHAVSMELLHGETLHRRIRTQTVSFADFKVILRQLVSGLESVHKAGILHRDFKTANVILTRDEGSGIRAVITDFGVSIDSAAPAESLTQFGLTAVVGTPAYMPPEQLRGDGASVASDVYSLGVVAFEMLTGRLPFEGDSSLAIALRRFGAEAPSPRTFRGDVPRRWAMAIGCCLAENPNQRPETPRQFLEVLEGNSGTLRVMARRHGRRAAVGAVAAVLLGAGVFEWRPRHRPLPDAEKRFKTGEVFVGRRSADSVANAIAEFRAAVGIDPNYAEAWASLANAYCVAIHYAYLDSKSSQREAGTAARKAISLDPDMAKAHGALAYLRSVDLLKWRSAGEEFRKALRLDSKEPFCHAWYAAFLGRSGRFQEAITEAKKAVELEPAEFYFNHQLAAEYFLGRKFKEYFVQSQILVGYQPLEVDSHLGLARALEWLRRFSEGLRECDIADRLAIDDQKSSMLVLCFRGTLEAATGDSSAARRRAQVVEDFWRTNPIESNPLVSLYARLGDYTKVIAILNAAFEKRDPSVLVCPANPYLDDMRGLPEYQAFLRKLGFDPAEVLKFGRT